VNILHILYDVTGEKISVTDCVTVHCMEQI